MPSIAPNLEVGFPGAPVRRPALLLSVAVDAALAALAYLASYWLRFPTDRLALFLPHASSTLPTMVAAQLLGLALAGAYAARPRLGWLLRVTIGGLAGTVAGCLILEGTIGFMGLSRMASGADGLLLVIAVVAWRGAWVISSRRAVAEKRADVPPDLVDRAEQTVTVGAVVTSLYSYRELLKNLVLKDLKLKYRGSVFGFLWSLANPLLMILVYTAAFTYILRVRSAAFVFYLMLGLLPWTFFASSASMSTGSIIDNAGLLKSVFFPRTILPIATVLFNFAQFILTMAVFLPLMILWYRVPLSPLMLLFPVFLALQTLFTIGVAMIVATATAFFRDVRHLLEVALQALFWTMPIVYQLDQIPDKLRLVILMSPMSPFIVAYQRVFYYRQPPDAVLWVVACTYAVGAFIIGTTLVLACEDRFAEQT
jgi:ABC-type polysaccharide/polyol phosphate export permease